MRARVRHPVWMRAVVACVVLALLGTGCASSAGGNRPTASGSGAPAQASAPAQAAQSPALAEMIRKANEEREIVLQMPEPNRRMSTAEGTRRMAAGLKQVFGVDVTIKQDSALSFPASAQKAYSELQAGAPPSYDLMWQLTISATPLYNDGLIERYDWLSLFPWLTDKDFEYGGQALISNTQFILPAYNTNLVRAADVPRTWDDVVDPKWKGKFASTIYQDTWAILAEPEYWGEERALEFVRKLAAVDPKLGRFPEVHQRVISGEVALTALDYASWVQSAKEEGAPVDVAVVEPVPVFVSIVLVPKNAKHSNAAALLAAWFLSEDGQALLEEGWVGTSLFKPNTPAAKFAAGKRLAIPSLDYQQANTARLQKQYEDIVVKK